MDRLYSPRLTKALKTILVVCLLFACQAFSLTTNSATAGAKELKSNPQYWPPRLNSYYPDLELMDQDGKKIRLSSFRGKVIIVEPIGMSCPACQAFSGANRTGSRPYGNSRPQPGLSAFSELISQQAGVSLSDSRIVFVQLIIYNSSMQAPSLAEVQAWARNFGLSTRNNAYVLVGQKNMVSKYSYNLIPGFQLIDKDFVLRSDSTGHNPKNDLYQHFFPMLKRVL